jgi:hypothetical protein
VLLLSCGIYTLYALLPYFCDIESLALCPGVFLYIAPELRRSLVDRYLILYRIITDGVQVVRVVHGARNLFDLF